MRSISVAALAVAALASAASAGVYTVSGSYAGKTDVNQTVSIAKFDASLGTLQSVDLAISYAINGKFFVENMSAGNGGYRLNSITWTLGTSGLAQTLVNKSGGTSTGLVTLAKFDNILDLADTSGATVNYGDNASFSGSYTGASAEFAGFLGAGTVDFAVIANVLTSHTVFGGASTSGFSTDVDFHLDATYTYFIPAPSSLAILGLGGLVAGRRRR